MLFHVILLHILLKVTFTKGNGGTAIFYNRRSRMDCWNDDDIIRLRARKAFEQLIPHVNPDEVDAKYIKDIIRYFRNALYAVDKETDPRTRILLTEAMSDSIGAHLRSEVLPAARFAYYAGYVSYRRAKQLHDLFDDIKAHLNTQGVGWTKPKRTAQKWSNLTVAKILIGAGMNFDPCSCLITKRDSNSCIHLPIPKHDDDRAPSAVALPFKSGGLVSLVAPSSNNVLLKYYTTASRCILSSSPEKCRHSDFVSFNNELWHWMKRDVAPHLTDEKLYAAYGGILRIAAAVQNYGKGLSRRNLFEYQDAVLVKWNPLRRLSESFIYVNADWTPTLYVGLVLLTAFSIYLVQICYTYICGDSGGCHCKGCSRTVISHNVAYTSIEPNTPAVLPGQSTIYYSDKKHAAANSPCRIKSASLSSLPTQKVYALNENLEQQMEAIMSDDEESIVESSSTESSAEEIDSQVEYSKRSNSPPKLQTPVSQVTVSRVERPGSRLPMYSTSTVTRTLTGSSRECDSAWSGTESSTSSRTGSSESARSRSSRDLAWARRVVSKHTRTVTKTSSRTELDRNSYTTPTTSQR